jgi:dihydropteroate synthase
MAILNVTPDSFSDGGRYPTASAAIAQALRWAAAGAAVIDVGGESTRPCSQPVSAAEQVDRVTPVIDGIRQRSDVLVCIDTTRAAVAAAALDAGADWINLTSALADDPALLPLAVRRQAAVVLMHRRGQPKTMQKAPHYDDAPTEVRASLCLAVTKALDAGLPESSLVIDPGIGFGKRLSDNLDLLARLDELACLGLPVLVGASRKSFLGELLGQPLEQRLLGTAASSVAAVLAGARLLRVHDVEPMLEVTRVSSSLWRRRQSRPDPGQQSATATLAPAGPAREHEQR